MGKDVVRGIEQRKRVSITSKNIATASSTVAEKGHSILPISVFPVLTFPISAFPLLTFAVVVLVLLLPTPLLFSSELTDFTQ